MAKSDPGPYETLPAKRQEGALETPGIGVAGEVICPIMSIGTIGGRPCIKHKCEFWVQLCYGAGTKEEHYVGRCALAWLPTISTEITTAIKKLDTHAKN